MKTEEGKLKDQVKAFLYTRGLSTLAKEAPNAVGYYNMYVPSGYGEPRLDFDGCYKSYYFAIETKAKGKEPTPRQSLIIRRIIAAHGIYVWDDAWNTLEPLMVRMFDNLDAR